jgi:hypothetical protein
MASGYINQLGILNSNGLISRDNNGTNTLTTFSGLSFSKEFEIQDIEYIPNALLLNYYYDYDDPVDRSLYYSIYLNDNSLGGAGNGAIKGGPYSISIDLYDQVKKSLNDNKSYPGRNKLRFDFTLGGGGTAESTTTLSGFSIAAFYETTPSYVNFETINSTPVETYSYTGYHEVDGSGYLKFSFSGIENEAFDRVARGVIRINALNNDDPAAFEVYGINAELGGRDTELQTENYGVVNQEGEVFVWGGSDLVDSTTLQTYDIDLSFINQNLLPNASGYSAGRTGRDHSSLFRSANYYVKGLSSGVIISGIDLLLYEYNDHYIPFNTVGGNSDYINYTVELYPSGFTTSRKLFKNDSGINYGEPDTGGGAGSGYTGPYFAPWIDSGPGAPYLDNWSLYNLDHTNTDNGTLYGLINHDTDTATDTAIWLYSDSGRTNLVMGYQTSLTGASGQFILGPIPPLIGGTFPSGYVDFNNPQIDDLEFIVYGLPSGYTPPSSGNDSDFGVYFNFSGNSALSTTQEDQMLDLRFPSGFDGESYEETSPTILNYFSSNLDRDNFGENNMYSPSDGLLQVMSGVTMSGDYTIYLHAVPRYSGVIMDYGSGHIILETGRVKVNTGGDTYRTFEPSRLTGYERDVVLTKVGNSFRFYYDIASGTNFIGGDSDFYPDVPVNNEVKLLSGGSGYLCELGIITSGWSSAEVSEFRQEKFNLQDDLAVGTSGYVYVDVPTSSGYNEIPLIEGSDFTIPQRDENFFEARLPVFVDYNTIQNTSGFYVEVETTSPVSMYYSGHFAYSNFGYIDFYGPISSGSNVISQIPAIASNNVPISKALDTNYGVDGRFIIDQDTPYGGQIRLHSFNTNLESEFGEAVSDKALSLFTKTIELSEGIVNFYQDGHYPYSSGLDFYSFGASGIDQPVNFFTRSNLKSTDSIDMIVANISTSSEDFHLFLSGAEIASNSIEFYSTGAYRSASGFDMFTDGSGFKAGSMNLFLQQEEEVSSTDSITKTIRFYTKGTPEEASINFYTSAAAASGESMNMFIGADTITQKSVEFFMYNTRSGINNSVDFYAKSATLMSGNPSSINMFIARDYEAIERQFDMYLNVFSGQQKSIDLVVDGAYLVNSGFDMHTSGNDSINDSLNLYSHGF